MPEIIYEDNHILVVVKKNGVLSQGDYSNREVLSDTLKSYIKEKYNKPNNVYLGTVHRLDREVSGLIIYARTSKAAARLSEDIRNKRIIKIYSAICQSNDFNNNIIILKNNLIRNKDKTFISQTNDSKYAELLYKDILINNNNVLKIIKLITGRKHQIRCQLSSLNSPILGDNKYGSESYFQKNGIALHSTYLEFIHPVKKEKMVFFHPNISFNKYFENSNLDEILRKEIETNFL